MRRLASGARANPRWTCNARRRWAGGQFMSLALLTRPDAVHAAMDEYDALGRDAFLAKYGYKPAQSYFVERGGRRYDSKAIAGAAVGKEHPEHGPLKWDEFSGGASTVSAKLQG